ncbi:MAG: substrate-binding domain-containing protein [Pirellulales bacterium]|nr:substrate-binding domain-containing protein [Pirellulales bacterium]
MNYPTTPQSKVYRLASLIEQDLRRRDLDTGDPYLTATEAGADFGVDQFTATRAMSLLAKRGILIRKRGVGTFVGEVEPETTIPVLRSLHVLKGSGKDEHKWGFPIGEIVEGLHETFPGFQVQSNILPHHNPAEMVRLIEQRTLDDSLAGMILLSCPREVQELVLENRLPAVSFGSVYPNTKKIPSIDLDQFESGRLQAEYLLKRGHRRIMLLMRENWRPGDNRLVDGVNKAMADTGLGFDSLVTRSIPEEDSLITNEIHRLLLMDDRPTGLICRCWRFAETALNAIRSRSMSVPDDLDIVFNHYDAKISAYLNLPRTCATLSSREQVKLVAQTLEKIINGKQLENNHVILPVKLVEPERVNSTSR